MMFFWMFGRAAADHDLGPRERHALPLALLGRGVACRARRPRALDLERELAELDLERGAVELVDRGLGADVLALQLLREEAQAVEAHGLDARVRARDAAAHARVLRGRAAVLLALLRERPDLLEAALEARHLGDARALVRERRDRDLPALPFLAEPVRDRHAHVVEEHLGEHRAAGHVLDRPHGDAGRVHRHEQAGDALVLRLRAASVRTSRMIHFDHIAIEVQIFWPFTT